MRNVSFVYKKSSQHIIKDFSLEIPSESLVRLTGPSGSGKTTFLELVGGIIFPTKWNIKIWEADSKDIAKSRFSLFGYSFVDADFFENMSVRDNILMPASIMKVEIDMKWYQKLIWEIGLKKYENKLVWNLSAGQRERVNLVRSMIHKPKILILDEPGSHLNTSLVWKIIQIILDYQKQEKATIFISSHQDLPKLQFTTSLSFYEDYTISTETNPES